MASKTQQTQELQMRVRLNKPHTYISMTPQEAPMQENLRDDTKALVAEYMKHLEAQLNPASWENSTVEIISTATLLYIQKLEALLEEAANDTADDEFATRIHAVIN
jgi:hypothetical protein